MAALLRGLGLVLTVALPVVVFLVIVAVGCGLAAWRRARSEVAIPKPRVEFVGFDCGLPFVEAADLETCAAPAPAPPATPGPLARETRWDPSVTAY